MKYLYPGGGDSNGRLYLIAPNMRGIPTAIQNGASYAVDTGCLYGPEFVKRCDIDKTLAWLETMKPYKDQSLFMTVPDVVGDAVKTFDSYLELSGLFEGWPLAYVAQDAPEDWNLIPLKCNAVFIGGSTEWKMSQAAVRIIKLAQKMGKHVHIGRVNYWSRYAHFRILPGSDNFTCDGTRIRYERNKALRFWSGYEYQLPMGGIWES